MSEPTAESEQVQQGDEPSMEDILASIRKIIADDDQVMDIAPPQPLGEASTVNEGAGFSLSQNLEGELTANTGVESNLQSRNLDEDSVFKGLLDGDDAELSGDALSSSEASVVDLDIDALLGGADFQPSSVDIPMLSEDDFVSDSLSGGLEIDALEMPEMDENADLSISEENEAAISSFLNDDVAFQPLNAETETVKANETLSSDSQNDSIFNESNIEIESNFAAEDESEDSLFAELESIISNEALEMPDMDAAPQSVESDVTDHLIEPVTDRTAKKGFLAAGLAGLGIGKAKSATKDVTESVQSDMKEKLVLNGQADSTPEREVSDFESMLNRLIDDKGDAVEPAIIETEVESDTEALIDSSEFDDIDFNLAGPGLNTDDEDMDLVKSLMADLTEPEVTSESVVSDIAPETVQLTELGSAEALSSGSEVVIPDLGDSETDNQNSDSAEADINIMDEILDMSLEDEIIDHPADTIDGDADVAGDLEDIEAMLEIPTPEQTIPDFTAEDIAAHELENIKENASEPNALTLSEIAASAESDAEALESNSQEIGDVDGVLGIVSLGAAAAGAGAVMTTLQTQEADIEALEEISEEETIDLEVPLESESATKIDNKKETADMARAAAKSDAILDDVTETATADAFASLNQLVEEQAITAERGDRIGDLVMEALRPMLKEWLDSNLKGIVERAVTKEVKRIASGK